MELWVGKIGSCACPSAGGTTPLDALEILKVRLTPPHSPTILRPGLGDLDVIVLVCAECPARLSSGHITNVSQNVM